MDVSYIGPKVLHSRDVAYPIRVIGIFCYLSFFVPDKALPANKVCGLYNLPEESKAE